MKKFLKRTLIVLILLFSLPAVSYFGIVSKYGSVAASGAQSGVSNGYDSFKEKADGAVRIMSFNLLADYGGFGGGEVSPRAERFLTMRNELLPDVLCLQEESFNWFCCLEKNRGDYRSLRPVTSFLGMKMTTVIFNSKTLKLLKSGDLEYENGDDMRTRRAVYGIFLHKASNKRFAVISTHLGFLRYALESEDIVTVRSQCSELSALSKKLESENNCPVIIAGDFNSKEERTTDSGVDAFEIYSVLKSVFSDTKLVAKNTLSGPLKSADALSNDHIFLLGNASVEAFGVVSDEYTKEISDHFPIYADIILS
ncbi:MAG: hypothetical protein PUK72_07950 [Oscillospiraceae bacterium]|nr:hypothetical protein [Oscillospiraceae bacterium]MDD7471005.1 hypothetical protein [Oscillospiraceae bacterium]MDY2677434.1 hypothetical protein [Oscillospiraceae bacterium]